MVFVEFDGYSGPETPAWKCISPSWVPIVPAVAGGRLNSDIYSVSSMMAWGITIPKIQGLTLDKVVVELGEKDFYAGLSFVAIS